MGPLAHDHVRQTLRRARACALTAVVLTLAACSGAKANPVVHSVSPATGSVLGGEWVTVQGSGFTNGCQGPTTVSFGTDPSYHYLIPSSVVNILSDTEIRAQTPASFAGDVDVQVTNSCGTSPAGPGDGFSFRYPASQCLSGTCSVSISPTAQGPVTHAALGLLNGLNTDAGTAIPTATRDLVTKLHPRQWRFGQAALGGGEFQLAHDSGATISLDLTSDWEDWATSNDPAAWQAPYRDLATYSTFIANDVRHRLDAGQAPDFYDVWNEPEPPGTVNQWLSVFGAAYRAIKAVDPNAKIVGPSLAKFVVTSAGTPDLSGAELSLGDFLDWEAQNGMHFDAISWHEDGATVVTQARTDGAFSFLPQPGGLRDFWSPAAFAAHVATARQLIGRYPSLAGTQVFVNEYGPPFSANIPGWMVGDISSLESAGADQAMLTCVNDAACTNQLDGLVSADGTPQMPYWVMSAYSQLTGDRLPVTSPSSNLYGIAAQQSSSVQALLGRADDCAFNACPQFKGSGHDQINMSVSIPVPTGWRGATVTVTDFNDSASNGLGANPVPTAPAAIDQGAVAVSNGSATVMLPNFGDGEARFIRLTEADAPQPTAAMVQTPGVASAAAVAPGSARTVSLRSTDPAKPSSSIEPASRTSVHQATTKQIRKPKSKSKGKPKRRKRRPRKLRHKMKHSHARTMEHRARPKATQHRPGAPGAVDLQGGQAL